VVVRNERINIKEAGMAHDENYHDSSGFLSILMGLIVLVGMACLPATIGWIQVFTG